jgi:flagellar L-ring protein precursor FlgH
MKLVLTVLTTLALGACSVLPREPLAHSEGFRPVYPIAQAAPQMATGSIYNGPQSESFFGRGRSFQVGDVITVLLNESTQAGRTQSGVVKRTSSNDVVPAAMGGGLLPAANLLGGTIKNEGSGTADQTATLTGSIAVSVVDVMANGNLVLRGEKQLALTEGAEIIQVAGVVRPDDIAPNSTVQSRRLANAQITYRGTGDMAAASRAGWATSGLLKLWPF